MDNVFPERLKELRIQRDLTIDMLVQDMNQRYELKLNKGTVSRWENGLTDPAISNVAHLAEYFNVSVDYMVGLTNVSTPVRLLAYAKKLKEVQRNKERE